MSYFPLLIKMVNGGEEMVVKSVNELPCGKAFVVIETNYARKIDDLPKFSAHRAKSIINQEGIGYATTYYCRGDSFKDPTIGKLWDNVAKACKELNTYIDKKIIEEIETGEDCE